MRRNLKERKHNLQMEMKQHKGLKKMTKTKRQERTSWKSTKSMEMNMEGEAEVIHKNIQEKNTERNMETEHTLENTLRLEHKNMDCCMKQEDLNTKILEMEEGHTRLKNTMVQSMLLYLTKMMKVRMEMEQVVRLKGLEKIFVQELE